MSVGIAWIHGETQVRVWDLSHRIGRRAPDRRGRQDGTGGPGTPGEETVRGEEEGMNEELGDYKQKVNPVTRATLTWDRDLLFTATTRRGYDMEFDAAVEWGCMPAEGLLMSVAGCMAIDVVSILTKMRSAPETFSLEIEGERTPEPPQRYLRIRMVLHLTGEAVTREKVDRAIALSREKYCSVTHSLREDIEVVVETDLRSGS